MDARCTSSPVSSRGDVDRCSSRSCPAESRPCGSTSGERGSTVSTYAAGDGQRSQARHRHRRHRHQGRSRSSLETGDARRPSASGCSRASLATPDAVAGVVARGRQALRLPGHRRLHVPGGREARRRPNAAANVDKSWIGTDAARRFEGATGCTFTVTNDADCAGVAEMRFGAGAGRQGVVIIVTLGTGIGTAVLPGRRAAAATPELGHHGGAAARTPGAGRPTASARRKHLDWKQWAKRVDEYLDHLEARAVARPDHHRRRCEQEGREVHPAAHSSLRGRRCEALRTKASASSGAALTAV